MADSTDERQRLSECIWQIYLHPLRLDLEPTPELPRSSPCLCAMPQCLLADRGDRRPRQHARQSQVAGPTRIGRSSQTSAAPGQAAIAGGRAAIQARTNRHPECPRRGLGTPIATRWCAASQRALCGARADRKAVPSDPTGAGPARVAENLVVAIAAADTSLVRKAQLICETLARIFTRESTVILVSTVAQ